MGGDEDCTQSLIDNISHLFLMLQKNIFLLELFLIYFEVIFLG